MAEEFIEDIYKYSKLISELRQVVRYIRIYDDHHAVMVLEELFPQICSLCEMAVRTEYPQIDLMWEKVVAVQKETADISIIGDFYEEDERVVRYARAYGVLDWIPQDRIKIVTQDCEMEFLKSLEDSQSGALMYLPSVNQLSDDFEKELVIKLGIAEKTFLTMGREMVINNWRNIEKNFPEAVELRDSFEAKEIVLAARLFIQILCLPCIGRNWKNVLHKQRELFFITCPVWVHALKEQ